jgi:soluble lytic murein transglycosylase-like protein
MTPSALLFLTLLTPLPPQHYVPGNPWSYQQTVEWYADANLVPRDLAMDLLRVESTNGLYLEAWREVPDPKRPKRKIRKLIAEGHFMVAKKYEAYHVANAGMRLEDYDPKNVQHSAQVGLAYMGSLLEMYHYDRRKSVAGYNAGPEAVKRWMQGFALPADTRWYLKEIFR